MREPEKIDDREAEVAVARFAAVDVAKASGVVCTRVQRDGAPGRFVTRVHAVDATTNAILELAERLSQIGGYSPITGDPPDPGEPAWPRHGS